MTDMEKARFHGDIFLMPFEGEVKGLPVEHADTFVLAEGERTGHKHVFRSQKSAFDVFQDEDDLFLVVRESATLTHEEHAALTVEPGVYHLEHEREYDWFSKATRRVTD